MFLEVYFSFRDSYRGDSGGEWGIVGEKASRSVITKCGNWTKNANFKRLTLMDIIDYGNPKLGTVCLIILAVYDLALFSRCTVKNN